MLEKTLQAVLESGHDYLVAVKGNQPTLLAHLKTISRHVKLNDFHHSEIHPKGRIEHRSVHVFHASGLKELAWPAVQSILWLQRLGIRHGKCVFA